MVRPVSSPNSYSVHVVTHTPRQTSIERSYRAATYREVGAFNGVGVFHQQTNPTRNAFQSPSLPEDQDKRDRVPRMTTPPRRENLYETWSYALPLIDKNATNVNILPYATKYSRVELQKAPRHCNSMHESQETKDKRSESDIPRLLRDNKVSKTIAHEHAQKRTFCIVDRLRDESNVKEWAQDAVPPVGGVGEGVQERKTIVTKKS